MTMVATRRQLLRSGGALAAGAAMPVGPASGAAPHVGQHRLSMVHHNPGEPKFVSNHNDPAWLAPAGRTGQVPRLFLPCTVTYRDLDPGLMPVGSLAWRKTAAYADVVAAEIARAKAAGMPLYPFTDLLVIPAALRDRNAGALTLAGTRSDANVIGGTALNASILAPRTEAILRAQIAEIFDRFPDLGGLTTRFGETYLHEWPEYAGGNPAASEAEQARLIAILRDELCVRRGKRLFYRTWDFGRFHTRPDLYLAITDPIEPHPLLCFSIKHVQADFLRMHPFNPCIGIGRHRQIVEISSNQAGLYGKNAHPYYIGRGVIDGWEEQAWIRSAGPAACLRDAATTSQYDGIWTWPRGDGWRGPYIANELWVDLNETVLHGFARNPDRSEPELFADAARRVTGIADAQLPMLRELCLLSADAVIRGQDCMTMSPADWTGEKAANPPPISYPQLWWCRDDSMSAVDLTAVVRAGKQAAALADKRAANRMWARIDALAQQIRLPDPQQDRFLKVSARYGRIKYALFDQIWRMQLMVAQAQLAGSRFDPAEMADAIAAYDRHWAEWQRLRDAEPLCPTLYSDTDVLHVGWPPFRTALDRYRRQV